MNNFNGYAIAVYRSRNVTAQAYDFLLKRGVTAALISTPRIVNVGCGLSVRFPASYLKDVRGVLSRGETFVGFYLVTNTVRGVTVVAV